MANKSGYKLHAKYENIPLEFGSPVLVNNANITEEYARKLLQHEGGERYFEAVPERSEEHQELFDAHTAALAALNALPEGAHHNKVKSAQKKVDDAAEALEQYEAKDIEVNEGEQADADDENTIKYSISQEDLDRVPELATAGYEVGALVLVDLANFTEVGGVTITNIISDLDTEE